MSGFKNTVAKSKPTRRIARKSRTPIVGSTSNLKISDPQIKKVASYSRSACAQTVSSFPRPVGRKNYISANSTRYKARFRREGIRYAQKKS